jgi:hypothetical protein
VVGVRIGGAVPPAERVQQCSPLSESAISGPFRASREPLPVNPPSGEVRSQIHLAPQTGLELTDSGLTAAVNQPLNTPQVCCWWKLPFSDGSQSAVSAVTHWASLRPALRTRTVLVHRRVLVASMRDPPGLTRHGLMSWYSESRLRWDAHQCFRRLAMIHGRRLRPVRTARSVRAKLLLLWARCYTARCEVLSEAIPRL